MVLQFSLSGSRLAWASVIKYNFFKIVVKKHYEQFVPNIASLEAGFLD